MRSPTTRPIRCAKWHCNMFLYVRVIFIYGNGSDRNSRVIYGTGAAPTAPEGDLSPIVSLTKARRDRIRGGLNLFDHHWDRALGVDHLEVGNRQRRRGPITADNRRRDIGDPVDDRAGCARPPGLPCDGYRGEKALQFSRGRLRNDHFKPPCTDILRLKGEQRNLFALETPCVRSPRCPLGHAESNDRTGRSRWPASASWGARPQRGFE